MSKPAERLLPRWFKACLALVGAVVLVLVLVYVLGAMATARWQRYAAQLRADGSPLTFEEIEAQRTKLPDDQNGALVILNLSERLEKVPDSSQNRNVFVVGRRGGGDDFFTGIARQRIEPSRAWLDRRREVLDKLAALDSLRSGSFPTPSADSAFANGILSELSRVRAMAKVLRLDEIIKLIDGDVSGAARQAVRTARVAASLDEYPSLIGRLVQIAGDALFATMLEDLLRVGELDDTSLQTLAAEVDARLAAGSMRWALLGERAHQIAFLDTFINATSATQGGGAGPPTLRIPSWVPRFLLRWQQIRAAELVTSLIEVADDPVALIKTSKALDRSVQTAGRLHFLLKIMMPSLSRTCELHAKSIAQLRCARVGLAAERFRMANAVMPDSIEALVPDFLVEVPLDPFDGEPLRFATTERGILVYSIDENMTDDGGDVAAPDHRHRAPDVGFRLHRPEHRGLLLIDLPESEDD